MTAGASTGLPFPLEPVVVVTGHYGVGKTNFALNLALDAAAAGYRATLADMDVVNPYFRSNEYRDLLEGAGVRLIAPVFGHTGTSLDVPSVTGRGGGLSRRDGAHNRHRGCRRRRCGRHGARALRAGPRGGALCHALRGERLPQPHADLR